MEKTISGRSSPWATILTAKLPGGVTPAVVTRAPIAVDDVGDACVVAVVSTAGTVTINHRSATTTDFGSGCNAFGEVVFPLAQLSVSRTEPFTVVSKPWGEITAWSIGCVVTVAARWTSSAYSRKDDVVGELPAGMRPPRELFAPFARDNVDQAYSDVCLRVGTDGSVTISTLGGSAHEGDKIQTSLTFVAAAQLSVSQTPWTDIWTGDQQFLRYATFGRIVTIAWSIRFDGLRAWSARAPEEIWPANVVYAAGALQMASYTVASAQALMMVDTKGKLDFRSSAAVSGEVWHEGSVSYPIGV